MAGPLTRAGRYEIVQELGRGSMGVVYQGFDPVIGRTVAIKTMLIEGLPPSEFEEYKQRFQREARSAGVLTHPNIVTVYDFGEDNGVLFLAMEYLEGKSIQQLVEKHNIMPIETLVPMYEQICGALDHAHQHKIVHRDIKPANIMILDSGLVKVMDFGIAKVMSMGMTQAGQILGTPNYMSPEQVKGRQVDGRSDIFSLGVILYELVTGEKPFGGQNITTVIYKIINEDPIPPRQLDATIHPGLSYVISKSLAKNPDERYQTCRELAEDLRNYKNLGGLGAPSATVVMRIPPIQTQPAERVQPPPPPQRSSPRVQARVAQPAVDAQIAPPYPQAPAPQPQRGPVQAPKFATVQPARRSSSSVAWAFIVVLLLAGVGGGGFYYYTNIYLPQQQANGTSAPPSAQPSTQPSSPTGGPQVAQNPITSTTTPGTASPNSTTPATAQPGASTAQSTNPEPTDAQPVKPHEPAQETPTPVTPTQKNGKVEISSNVRGADITVDGHGTGLVTPHTLELAPGEHTISVSMDGYDPSKITVEVNGGRAVSKRIVLAEETTPTPKIPENVSPPTPTPVAPNAADEEKGSITIITTPAGLDISIDGKPAGKSPAHALLPPGNHTYTYTCPNSDPQTATFEIKANAFATGRARCQ